MNRKTKKVKIRKPDAFSQREKEKSKTKKRLKYRKEFEGKVFESRRYWI